ncbi:MAG: hypothetical protein ACRDWH_06835 [Acidimicrobiia bacterium]
MPKATWEGATLRHRLAKLGFFVVDHDAEKLRIVRTVRDEILMSAPPPTSTLLGVAKLALPDLLIEGEGVADIEG